MLYFLTCPEDPSDKYNVIYGLGKRLPGYFYFALTDDNRQPGRYKQHFIRKTRILRPVT